MATSFFILFLGDTGPLVYPAAFVYIYSILFFVTSYGANVRLAQYIFVGIYMLQLWLVLRLYTKSRKVPPYVIVLSIFTSYRIHSIYSLRLFNDPVAMVIFYAALNLFMERRWTIGSVMFSLAVGVKMNVLLFAPAILVLYLTSLGYVQTIVQLTICAVVQLLIGAPFLVTYPVEYIRGSFDLGRVFEHKWTVNYRFLPRELFEDKVFHLTLLALHLILLIFIAKPCIVFFKNYARLRNLQKQFEPQVAAENRAIEEMIKQKRTKAIKKMKDEDTELTQEQKDFLKSFEKGMQQKYGDGNQPKPKKPEEEDPQKVQIHFDQCVQLALLPIFLCNFIGIVFARSLHYQFYVWYFHSLPHLVWFTNYHTSFKILILFLIEHCWNVYPSTIFTSLLLHACHMFLLGGIVVKLFKETYMARKVMADSEKKD